MTLYNKCNSTYTKKNFWLKINELVNFSYHNWKFRLKFWNSESTDLFIFNIRNFSQRRLYSKIHHISSTKVISILTNNWRSHRVDWFNNIADRNAVIIFTVFFFCNFNDPVINVMMMRQLTRLFINIIWTLFVFVSTFVKIKNDMRYAVKNVKQFTISRCVELYCFYFRNLTMLFFSIFFL